MNQPSASVHIKAKRHPAWTPQNLGKHLISYNKLKPIIILWDQDGVQQDWTEGLNRILLKLDPNFPIVPDHERRDYNHLAKPGADKSVLREALHHPDLYRSLEIIPETIQAMKEIDEDDRFIQRICTMPEVNNPACASAKVEAVTQYLGGDWPSRIIMTSDKTLVRGDYLIDDKPSITGSMTPTWKHILFDRPYNRIPAPADTHLMRLTDPLRWRDLLSAELEAAA